MKTARKLVGIEYFRVAAAFLVVAIHCSPLLTYSETADFIFTRVLARAAVPFFFMVTGYFVIGKPEKTRKFLKKTGVIYLASILLYLPLNLYAGNFNGLTPGAALTQLLFEGTFYHLWYLPAALLGVLAASLLARSRAGLGIAGALYLLGLLGDSYWGLVSGVPVVSDVYNVIFSVAGYTRNGLFFAPLFLLLGAAMRGDRLPGKGVSAAGLAAAFALMLAEALLLRRLGWQRHDSSMYVFLPAVMYFLFALLLNEVRKLRFKKFVQTVVYLPHFLSWVILASVLLEIFGYRGVFNSLLSVFGIEGKIWFSEESCFRQLVIFSDVWKEFGFNAVIYLAALTGISPDLYEAAAIDGCGRLKAVWYITLPGIVSTIVVMGILGLGNVLNAGFDQIFNLYSPLVYSTGDILDWTHGFTGWDF